MNRPAADDEDQRPIYRLCSMLTDNVCLDGVPYEKFMKEHPETLEERIPDQYQDLRVFEPGKGYPPGNLFDYEYLIHHFIHEWNPLQHVKECVRLNSNSLSVQDSGGRNALHHACSRNLFRDDSLVVGFIAESYPEGAKSLTRLGRLPLHIFLSNTKQMSKTSMESLLPLIRAYPEAAKVVDCKTGRLPLHAVLALPSSKLIPDAVTLLAKAYPESLQMRDPVSKLLPWQLAAANKKGGRKDCFGKVICSTIFTLLRADPRAAAVSTVFPKSSGGGDNNEYQDRLVKENKRLRQEIRVLKEQIVDAARKNESLDMENGRLRKDNRRLRVGESGMDDARRRRRIS